MPNTSENDNCTALKAQYTVYPVLHAVALWCGAPDDMVQKIIDEARPLHKSGIGRSIFTHPSIPDLEFKSRAIAEAIESGSSGVR